MISGFLLFEILSEEIQTSYFLVGSYFIYEFSYL